MGLSCHFSNPEEKAIASRVGCQLGLPSKFQSKILCQKKIEMEKNGDFYGCTQ